MTDDIPSCGYDPARPCDRPRECPRHRELLKRPRLKRHMLSPSRRAQAPNWPAHPVTLCGLLLHDHMTPAMYQLPVLKRMALEQQGYRPMPHPHDDPAITVYYLVGWGWREVLIVSSGATCKRCRAVLTKP